MSQRTDAVSAEHHAEAGQHGYDVEITRRPVYFS